MMLPLWPMAGAAEPIRVVSINMCADELLLRLAEPGSIAAVSHLSRDPRNSAFAAQAAAYPVTHGRAEEVMALAPDLVLASAFTAPATLSMLRRLGVPLATLGVPHTFDGIADQMREVARLLGRPENGEREVRRMAARLAAAASDAPARATALVLQANNIVVGRDTLIDGVLAQAGLVNLAARDGIAGYGRMSLEAIVSRPPDILIVDSDEERNAGAPALATRALRHPALAALARQGAMRVIAAPSRLWTCAGPGAAEAVAYLRHALAAGTGEAP
ncbi:MAG: ABC transporter substrate-binding protein [Pseudochelatococcus sp.]|jgi:iron complex transport system substrate-binding protein|uniref:ABC transporter substrate-binding protein n=1 Tax=Pseudochelatococcus sp. TaxID=2020869 RepID=UPI003D946886